LDRAVDVVRPGGSLSIMLFVRPHPGAGPLRWAYPFYRALVERAGARAADYLDEARVCANWRRGRERLIARLGDLHEEPHLDAMGVIAAGTVGMPSSTLGCNLAAQTLVTPL